MGQLAGTEAPFCCRWAARLSDGHPTDGHKIAKVGFVLLLCLSLSGLFFFYFYFLADISLEGYLRLQLVLSCTGAISVVGSKSCHKEGVGGNRSAYTLSELD